MKKIVLTVFALFNSVLAYVSAQAALTLPYSMSFEESESAEWSHWVVNKGAESADERWIQGEEMHSEGSRSLYISSDGVRAQYFTGTFLQYAYRDIVFPTDGFYDISFDWYAEGSEISTLSMGLGLASSDLEGSTMSGVLPSSLLSTLQFKNLYGSTAWHNESVRLAVVAGRVYRLYFVWTNSNQDEQRLNYVSAAIDNVQINSSVCARPQNFSVESVECGTLELNWQGASSAYEFEYRNSGEGGRWLPVLTQSAGLAGSVTLANLPEGRYDFRVRGICEPDMSGWAYISDYLVFCPENRCINYVDLHNSERVTCTYGNTLHEGYDHSSQNAYDNIGVVDYGPDMEQRHKVIWDRQATDPRTKNKLSMIAPGEFASVRLGNWSVGRGAESVSYRYTVDEDHPILLLNYAVVMQDPKHSSNEQPRFVLEILNSEGELISQDCGYCNFASGGANPGEWFREGGLAHDAVMWKDWSTIGLNLEDYSGEEVRVRVTTYDCFESQHYGYAYFSMGCTESKINVAGCAGDDEITLTAPVGFRYSWRNSKGVEVGTERTLVLPSTEQGEYTCRLSNLENPSCSFELKVMNDPKLPISRFDWVYEPSDCRNTVRFINQSLTRTIHDYEDITDTPGCESYEWHFGYAGQRNMETNPVFTYPETGGTFPVTLYAGIGSGTCLDDTTIYITLPAIGDRLLTIDTTLCRGSVIEFGEQLIGRGGHYEVEMKTPAGCDSTMILDVRVVEPDETILPDTTIFEGTTFVFAGNTYNFPVSGLYRKDTVNRYGCDSVVFQRVTVEEIRCVDLVMTTRDTICDGDIAATYELTILSGAPTTYSVLYDERAHQNGFTDIVREKWDAQQLEIAIPEEADANIYTAVVQFHNLDCADIVDTIAICVLYPSSVLFTRWDDVISLCNAEYAGYGESYSFEGYQWYIDGETVDGAVASYYYQEGGLTIGAEYVLELHRTDGVVISTCPLILSEKDIRRAPATSTKKTWRDGHIYIVRDGGMYNLFGERVGDF